MLNKVLNLEATKFLWFGFLALVMFNYVVLGLGGLYAQCDSYYYLSILDEWLKSGQFFDSTVIPKQPVISPQNGIVFVMALVKWLGVESRISQLYAVSIINYCFFVWFCYLVYKIYKLFNIDKHVAFVVATQVVLSLSYNRVFFQSINDAIFITLTTFVFYIILKKEEDWKSFTLLALSCLVLSEFRLAGVLVFISASLTYLLFGKIRIAALFLGFALLSYVTQHYLLHLFVHDQSGIIALKKTVFDAYSYDFFLGNLVHTISATIPEGWLAYDVDYSGLGMLTVPPHILPTFPAPSINFNVLTTPILIGMLLASPVLIAFLVLLQKSYSSRAPDVNHVLLLVYIAAYLCFFQLFVALVSRYIMPVAPFFTLVLFLSLIKTRKYQLLIAYSLLALTILISISVPPHDAFSKDGLSKKAFTETMSVALHNVDYDLLSEGMYARLNYLFLNKSSYLDPDKTTKNNVLIVGHKSFVDAAVQQLVKARGGHGVDIRQLSSYLPYYEDTNTMESYLVTIL